MLGQIYLLIDKRNSKKYVGKHNGNKKNYFTGGVLPNNIIKKHGKEVFERIILEDNIENLEKLNELEIFYIQKYDTFKNGYNLTLGGDGGGDWIYRKTESEIEKIANIKSEKLKGRIFSDATKELMSNAKKGIPLTEEHIENIKKSQSGENHPWYGKQHSDETKKKISKSHLGKKNTKLSEIMKDNVWNQTRVCINAIEYHSIAGAARILGLAKSTVRSRCNSKKWTEWFKL
jgi:group I intron endonuclease